MASGASWHLVAINSECAAGLASQVGWSGGCDAGSAQERWLRNDLANHPSDRTLACWHHPLFSSGGIGNNVVMKPIWQALYEAMRLDESSWGILELTLHGADSAHPNGWYEWQFRPDGNSGTFTDSGSADCVQPAPPSASFTLSATPPSQSVARGGSVDYTVKVNPANGFIGSVNLSVSGLPPRSTASFNPNPTESSSNSSTLTITTSNKTKRGTFTLTNKGMSGSMASNATVELTVSP